MKEFTQEEKGKLFDEISNLYFKQNFGSTSKSDLETLLFSEYLDHCIEAEENYDDYSLSKQLGITQSRIRALKERKELKYPYNDGWKTSFAKAIENARYDASDHYIKVIIQDVNVMNEVRNYIEKNGWYDECSLNKKLLRIPLDCFTDICLNHEDLNELFSAEAKNRIRELSANDSAVAAFVSDFTVGGLKSFLMSASKEAVKEVLTLLPFGGVAKIAFDFLGGVIERM